ncbi:hypothetical protein GCM10022259_06880 [Aquimarina mytili]
MDSFFKETSTCIDGKSVDIVLLDVFKNKTNYVWYASNRKTASFFRFISDLDLKNVRCEKIEKSIIKNELESLKSE